MLVILPSSKTAAAAAKKKKWCQASRQDSDILVPKVDILVPTGGASGVGEHAVFFI